MLRQKLIFLFLVIFSLSLTPKVFASTTIDADIIENITWTLENSPYVVNAPITIITDATLSIESGVIVKFDSDSGLLVDGALNVLGTDAQPVYFTSYADDSIGGDTNGDGENSHPSMDDWSDILIGSVNQSTLNHLILRYGGYITLYNRGSIISDTLDSDNGIFLLGSHSSFANLTIPNIEIINGSVVSIDGATISNHDIRYNSAIAVFGESSLILKNATVQNYGFDDVVDIYQNSTADFDKVDITGNIFSDSGIMVFEDSSIKLNESSISDVGNGLKVYGNSNATITDFSLACDIDGVSVYENSSLDFSRGSVVCGNDGIILYDEARVAIDDIKVSGAADAGIIAFSNYNSNPITITNSEITGNEYGFVVFNTAISAHQNNIHGNTIGALAFSPLVPNQFDLSSNYWGDRSGPNNAENPLGLGDIVSGDVLFNPWCKNESCISRSPVIIVPGVLGTEISKPIENGLEKLWLDLEHNLLDIGDQFMDALQFNNDLTPSDTSLVLGDVIKKATLNLNFKEVTVFDYTGSLIEEFQDQGYVEGVDLFLFPYDWRYGVNEDNVNKLKQKIDDVLAQTDEEKVDVIAHSTGGLIVKKYVMENPTDNHIDKAVFVGVPNTGAPKAIKAFIQGDNFGNLLVADSEMKKIAKNFPVAYDLSPSEQYFNAKGSYVKVIDQYLLSQKPKNLNFEESNMFLIDDHELNAQALVNSQNLHTADFDNYDMRTAGVDLYAIDGCKAGTIGKFVEARYHGILGGEDYIVSNFKIEEIPGDGTVPLESSTNLPINEANKFYALKSEHGKMLSQNGIRQEIVNLISGSILSTQDSSNRDLITQDIAKCKLNGRAISIFSPLSIEVVDQDGNHSGFSSDGVSLENNIPNADFQIIDGHKFIYLPTDEGQTYTISVTGTGTGVFTLTDASIVDDDITQTQVFSNIAVTPSLLGSVILSDNTTLSLDDDGNGIVDQNLHPSLILNASESQDFIPAPPNENPPEEEPNDASAVIRPSGGGGHIFPPVSQNVPVTQPIAVAVVEVPPEIPVVEQENPIPETLTSTKNTKIKESVPEKIENLPQENTLTANVVDTGTSVDYRIIAGGFFGILVLLLVAKKFIKE